MPETILPRALRPPGTYTTDSLPIPAGATSLRLEGDLAADVLTDAQVTVVLALNTSNDGGNNWEFVTSVTCVGTAGLTAQPYVAIDLVPAGAGLFFRGQMTVISERIVAAGMKASAA